MKFDSLMIHYGELSTKGSNRKNFIQMLTHNVRVALAKFPSLLVKGTRDHIYVALGEEEPMAVISRLQEVAGIQKISLVHRCGKALEEIQSSALALLQGKDGQAFKIDVKRADKTYPLDSYHVACEVADYLLDHTAMKVDLHHYEVLLKINLREDACYLSYEDYPGLGGYPLGMNGKVLMLLSGGIDSPVASYALLRRGIKIECLHFASPPYTSWGVIDKLKDILGALNEFQPSIKLDVVAFTKLQEAIYANVPEPYCITIMRRMMMRIAVGVAKKAGCLAIATGESVGQVASQTLESMNVINEVTNFPILRPLAASDKLSIIETSRHIGTYEISIRPFEDCCTIFKPKKPKTKPRLEDCLYYESKFDYAPLVEECIASYSSIYMAEGQEIHPKVNL